MKVFIKYFARRHQKEEEKKSEIASDDYSFFKNPKNSDREKDRYSQMAPIHSSEIDARINS